jgi:hypothetical protein
MISPVSDDWDLRERILRKLVLQGICLAPCLTLEVHERVVTVRGNVSSYYERQRIVHSILLVPGHYELHDLIAVVPPAGRRVHAFADSANPPHAALANVDELTLTN